MKNKIVLVVEVKDNGEVSCDGTIFKKNTNIARFIKAKLVEKTKKEKSNG